MIADASIVLVLYILTLGSQGRRKVLFGGWFLLLRD
jgi:hypothetical protein